LHDSDFELAKQIVKQTKSFYVLRTQFDLDIKKKQTASQRRLTEEDIQNLLINCRGRVEICFAENLIPKDRVFCVSALMDRVENVNNTNKYEFPQFKKSLIYSLAESKRNSLLFALFSLDKGHIETKCNMLRIRIGKVSRISAVSGLSPIPGTSAAVDLGILLEEVYFYIKTLRLSKDSIERFVNGFDVSYDDLERDVLDKHPFVGKIIQYAIPIQIAKSALPVLFHFLTALLLEYLGKYFAANAIEETIKGITVFIPVIGIAIASGIGSVTSYFTMYYSLNFVLKQFEETLIDINDYCRKHSYNHKNQPEI